MDNLKPGEIPIRPLSHQPKMVIWVLSRPIFDSRRQLKNKMDKYKNYLCRRSQKAIPICSPGKNNYLLKVPSCDHVSILKKAVHRSEQPFYMNKNVACLI